MEANNRPLALRSWTAQRNSYTEAVQAVGDALHEQHSRDPALDKFIDVTLHQRVFSQSGANWDQYRAIETTVTGDETDYVEGMRLPSELVGYLLWHENLQSIETGRRTHPYDWNVGETFDKPIRADLDSAPFLGTRRQKSPTLYRFKNLNLTDTSEQYTVQVDRKRTIRRHFGGRVLNIVRNSVVLHDTDPNDGLPEGIKALIQAERDRARSDKEYDYDDHSTELREYLEAHLSRRATAGKPSWVTPILTTYYAAKIDAVKAEELKQIVEE